MIVYTDKISGDEMFSDSHKVIEKYNGTVLMVQGKMVKEETGISDALIGGNKSAEDVEQDTVDDQQKSVIDIVSSHRLTETSYDKKSFKTYVRDYVKKLAKIEEEQGRPLPADEKKALQEFFQDVLKSFEDYQFFLGESLDADAQVVLCKWDGPETPVFYYVKKGLDEVKF